MERVARRRAGIAPLLGERLELVDVLRDRGPRAAAVGEGELVQGLDALDVRGEHPLVVHALVGHEERPSLGLLEDAQRAEVVTERLVAEAAALEVQQHAVLAVVEGQVGELERVAVRDARRDQMAVEAGAVARERAAGLEAEPQPVAGAVRVGPQRDVGGEGMDVASAQLRVASEAPRGEQRRACADLPCPP